MKKILSILLLLITMAYIMPVKFCASTKDSITLNASEKNCEETPEIKKDNSKELFNTSSELYTLAFSKPASHNKPTLLLSFFCGFVETPPPDFL